MNVVTVEMGRCTFVAPEIPMNGPEREVVGVPLQVDGEVIDLRVLRPLDTAAILDSARQQEREIRLGAEDYADEMLANLEVNLGKLLTAVQRGRDRLQGKVNQRQ